MKGKRRTPKQVLLGHIKDMHHRQPAQSWTMAQIQSWTMAQMAKWHAEQHHRYSPNHYHEGVNLGPALRPAGWYTGEGGLPHRPTFSRQVV